MAQIDRMVRPRGARGFWSTPACSLSAVALCQHSMLAGREHDRTIPLADVAVNRFTRLGVPDRFAKLHQIGALPSILRQ